MSNEAPTKDDLRVAEFMAEQQLLAVVRQACDESGLDRQEIARRLGIHRSNVSKLLNSPRNMTVRMAGRLMRAVGKRLFYQTMPVIRAGQSRTECLQEITQNVVSIQDRVAPYQIVGATSSAKSLHSKVQNVKVAM